MTFLFLEIYTLTLRRDIILCAIIHGIEWIFAPSFMARSLKDTFYHSFGDRYHDEECVSVTQGVEWSSAPSFIAYSELLRHHSLHTLNWAIIHCIQCEFLRHHSWHAVWNSAASFMTYSKLLRRHSRHTVNFPPSCMAYNELLRTIHGMEWRFNIFVLIKCHFSCNPLVHDPYPCLCSCSYPSAYLCVCPCPSLESVLFCIKVQVLVHIHVNVHYMLCLCTQRFEYLRECLIILDRNQYCCSKKNLDQNSHATAPLKAALCSLQIFINSLSDHRILRGPSHQTIFAQKWYGLNRFWWGYITLDL
jgi:hypothetical protein